MKLFSKKELLYMKEFVVKQNKEYFKSSEIKDDDLYKKNKSINDIYRIISKK